MPDAVEQGSVRMTGPDRDRPTGASSALRCMLDDSPVSQLLEQLGS